MKTYVKVETISLPCGFTCPTSIRWKDGRIWKISKVLHTCTPAAHEFEGIRYTIIIGSAEKYLYKDNDKWYVVSS